MIELVKIKIPKAAELTKALQAEMGFDLNPFSVATVIAFFEGVVYDSNSFTIKRRPNGILVTVVFANGDYLQVEQPSLSEAMLSIIKHVKEKE